MRAAIAEASKGLVEREALVELIVLAAVAGEHLLVIGPPGTAKSEAVRRVSAVLGARTFEYLLGRFTEPSELFGPVDLRKLREGVVETATAGMLPEAEFAFLDELFLGSTAILNTLLGLLNERRFRRGHTSLAVPLRSCIGAANQLPDEPALAAFADRFLLRAFVEPVPDPSLESMLAAGWGARVPTEARVDLATLDALARAARAMELDSIRSPLAHGLRLLRKAGLVLSDRRAVQTQKLIAAAAVLAGRSTPSEADLWPVLHAVPTLEGQKLAREVLGSWLARSANPTLSAAASEASLGVLARADRLVAQIDALLAAPPVEGAAREPWELQLEGLAREVDVGFAPAQRPAPLEAARTRLTQALTPPPTA